MTKMNNKCLSCGTEMKMKVETVKHDEGGLDITLMGVPVYRCPKCGDREVEIPNLGGLHREIAHSLAHRPSRLRPAEIRFMRKYLGLSMEDLAKRLKTGLDTVKHWEAKRARRMSPQAEVLLRWNVLLDQTIDGYGLGDMPLTDAPAAVLKAKPEDGTWRVNAA